MTDIAHTIGHRIKEARHEIGLTQNDVAQQLGIGRQAYSHIENGHSQVTVDHLLRLREVLARPVTYFLGLDHESPQEITRDERDLLDTYRQLHPLSKRAALSMVRGLKNDEIGFEAEPTSVFHPSD